MTKWILSRKSLAKKVPEKIQSDSSYDPAQLWSFFSKKEKQEEKQHPSVIAANRS